MTREQCDPRWRNNAPQWSRDHNFGKKGSSLKAATKNSKAKKAIESNNGNTCLLSNTDYERYIIVNKLWHTDIRGSGRKTLVSLYPKGQRQLTSILALGYNWPVLAVLKFIFFAQEQGIWIPKPALDPPLSLQSCIESKSVHRRHFKSVTTRSLSLSNRRAVHNR